MLKPASLATAHLEEIRTENAGTGRSGVWGGCNSFETFQGFGHRNEEWALILLSNLQLYLLNPALCLIFLFCGHPAKHRNFLILYSANILEGFRIDPNSQQPLHYNSQIQESLKGM